MASEKLTDLDAIPVLAAADSIYVVDASDTTDDAAGSSKKITAENMGARYLIEEITLGSAGEFDFNSIPAGFNRLSIKGLVRGTVSSTSDILYVLLNADTTLSNYHSQRLVGFDNSSGNQEYSSEPRIANCSAASSASGLYSSLNIDIEDYAGSHRKMVNGVNFTPRDAAALEAGFHVALSSVTAAVTRVRIRADDHPTDGLVGTLRLYGEF